MKEPEQELQPTERLSKGANDWVEGLRLRAWELMQQGWSQGRIAETLDITQGARKKQLSELVFSLAE